jgi:Nuclease-related domain
MLKDVKTGDRLTGWMRQRELASDRRAGQFSRSEAVKRQYAWARRNWRIMGGLMAFVIGMLPLVLLLPDWSRGFAAGIWLATGFWLLAFEVVLASGTAPRMMGDRGEQFTASELRRMQRRGWRVINHVSLKRHTDIDHVAVGIGGVLVIETKWSGDPWTLDAGVDERVRRAVDRIAPQATAIRRMFPNHVAPSAIVPVLVLWGGYNADDVGRRVIDGVTVLRGAELCEWLAAREPEVTLTISQQDHVWRTLERLVRGRDAFDLNADGRPPRTPGEWALVVGSVMFSACVGILASATAWTAWQSFPSFFAAEAVLIAIGWVALRRRGLAPAAVAWLASVLAVGALVAVAAVSIVL